MLDRKKALTGAAARGSQGVSHIKKANGSAPKGNKTC